jgi:allantoin racemase
MRLLIVNPNTTASMTRTIDEAAHLYAHPETEIVTVQPPRGPRSIEGYLDAAVAAEATLEVLLARRAEFDGFVIACFDDPGLYAAREALDRPVFGIAEAAMLVACTLGHSFSVLTAPARSKPTTGELVRRYGLEHRCASVRTIDLPVLALDDDAAATRALFAAEGRRAMEEDGAEVLLLGCAGLAHFDKELERELGVPVLDGVACAVKLAESCIGYGLRTSKFRGFAPVAPKEYVGDSGDVVAVQAGT